MNSFSVLQALIFEPKKAFAALAERPRIVLPLILLVVTTAGMLFWYFSVVDVPWLLEQAGRGSRRAAQMTEQQRQAVQKIGPVILKWSSLVGGAIGVVLIRLLEALYYMLAGKITNVQRSYLHWLALASWSSLPAVLSIIPAAVVLLTATTTQLDQSQLQPLSLNSLFFHRAAADPGYSLLGSINLLQLLGMYLATLGVRVWSGRSWLFSAVFTCLPVVLVYGVWAVYSLVRA